MRCAAQDFPPASPFSPLPHAPTLNANAMAHGSNSARLIRYYDVAFRSIPWSDPPIIFGLYPALA